MVQQALTGSRHVGPVLSRIEERPGAQRTTDTLASRDAEKIALVHQSGEFRHILFVPGPGDVFGTFQAWSSGRDDPSIPNIAYSAQIYELAAAIGARLTVLTAATVLERAKVGDVEFVHLARPAGQRWRWHASDIRYGRAIVREANLRGVDTILLQGTLGNFWPLLAARRSGVRVFVSLHNSLWTTRNPPWLLGLLNGGLFRKCDGVIGVSHLVANQVRMLAGHGGQQVSVQIPQYPASWREPPVCSPQDRAKGPLLYVGRIEANKGVFDLLKAFIPLTQRFPHQTLRFVGEGSAADQLRAAIAELPEEIRCRVSFPGACAGGAVRQEMARSRLLVCPTRHSFSEGLAKTPIEAILMGTPAIVTDAVPARDLLGDAVCTVPAEDPSAVSDAIAGLLSDAEQYAKLSRAGQARRAIFFDRRRSLATELLGAMAAKIAP